MARAYWLTPQTRKHTPGFLLYYQKRQSRTEKGKCELYKADVFRYAKGIKFIVIPPSSLNLQYEFEPGFLNELQQI